jgi:hypothetical protein
LNRININDDRKVADVNVQTPKWYRLSDVSLPPAHVGSALAYNAKDQTVLLIGGSSSSADYNKDFWLFNGNKWEKRTTYNKLAARTGMSLTWDDIRMRVVLFGGMEYGKYLGDTWLFNGVEWGQIYPPSAPSPRAYASLTYDAKRDISVLFGGFSENGQRFPEALNELWRWDGENWEHQALVNLPSPRFGASMVFDKAHGTILLFGGGSGGCILGDTWVYDGDQWKEKMPSSSPPPRAYFGMAYHEKRQQVVLFGGQSYNGIVADTWVWDGKDWSELRPTQSPPHQVAYGAQLVYLPFLESIMLYNAFREKKIYSDESFTMTEHSDVWILDF